VATSEVITGPSRLLFPRELGGVGEASAYPYSLLGLGDVALPGLLACLALRYIARSFISVFFASMYACVCVFGQASHGHCTHHPLLHACIKVTMHSQGQLLADLHTYTRIHPHTGMMQAKVWT